MVNPLLELIEKRKAGIHCGVPSFCSANKLVIEAILNQAKRFDDTVLIEATSNQVNQLGGYTGMTPIDFRDYVYDIADSLNVPHDRIILGGDHMGPLPWADLDEEEAMQNAEELVRACVRAGYTKIHLDTSMRLASDPIDKDFEDRIAARRGARLYLACEDEFEKYSKQNPDAVHPVYIIGSEVPVPGGSQEEEDELQVTSTDGFKSTLKAYYHEFAELGIKDFMKYIIAIVVQPGVEFGNHNIHAYDRLAAYDLTNELKKYPDIVFEGHSTDYQSPMKLREMVEDGIAIIKVGPALTFAVRDALFALSFMEKELIKDKSKRANFIEVLEESMLVNPKNWEKYYPGDANQQAIDRRYSLSDRCRYYFANDEVNEAINKLFDNLSNVDIPLGMLHQYMPLQYVKVRDGRLKTNPKDLVLESVIQMVDDYNYAVKYNYMTSSILVR